MPAIMASDPISDVEVKGKCKGVGKGKKRQLDERVVRLTVKEFPNWQVRNILKVTQGKPFDILSEEERSSLLRLVSPPHFDMPTPPVITSSSTSIIASPVATLLGSTTSLASITPLASESESPRRNKRQKVDAKVALLTRSEDRVKLLYGKLIDELLYPLDSDLPKLHRERQKSRSKEGEYLRKLPRVGEAYQANVGECTAPIHRHPLS